MTPAWKWSKKHGGWCTQVSLPRLGAWRCLWSIFPGGADGPLDDNEDAVEGADRALDVVAWPPDEGPRPKSPSPAQQVALARLPADEEALEGALAAYLFDAMRDGRLGTTIPEPGDAENEDERRLFGHLHRPEAMRELLRLGGVEVLADEEGGLARVVLDFESAFDGEHGLSVCVHGSRVLSHGGLGEQGGWPPPDEDDLAAVAAMFGRPGPRDERQRLRTALEDALTDPVNGEPIRELTRAALALADDPNQRLEITVRIDTPPVTRVEKVYYGQAGTLGYDLTIGVGLDYVVYKDSNTPRQAALQGAPWPLSLFAAQCRWPAARPRWEAVRVRQVDQAASVRKNKTVGPERPELRAAAEAALREGFDPTRLAARGWRLPPDPSGAPGGPDPTPGEQALGAGMMQALQAMRGLLTGDPNAPPPPDLAALLAGASGAPGKKGLFAAMTAACELVPVPAGAWSWFDESRGRAIETALTRAGLHRAGQFQVLMPFTPGFAAYVDERRRFYALAHDDVYQRAVTLECRSLYGDGRVFAVTTRAAAAPLPPWRTVEVLAADTDPADVVKRFLARRPAAGLHPVDADRLAADFQDVWRREAEWRAKQGR